MRARIAIIGWLLASVACATETLVHNLEEKEANQIIELLAENDISAQKGQFDTGRAISYTISVATKSRIDAIKLLNLYEMPRRRDMGYNEIFKESGLIPTSGEEKAKALSALEGEVEKQLKLVDGILDVQVQLVLPEDNALRVAQEVRTATTASVTIKYMPGAGGTKPLSEPQVQAVVAAGVERLTPDNVVVVMTPGGRMQRANSKEPEAGAASKISEKNLRLGMFVVFGLIISLCLVLLVLQVRLRTVRGRLVRLQSEIARARRKPGEPAPPGA